MVAKKKKIVKRKPVKKVIKESVKKVLKKKVVKKKKVRKKSGPKLKVLTPKQKLFCIEYLKDTNATRAAVDAGYSKKTAQVIGSENLSKPMVQEEIRKQNKKRFDKVEDEGLEVIKELKQIGHSDISDYVEIEKDGSIRAKTLDKMRNTGVISSIEETTKKIGSTLVEKKLRFKLWDKNKALENLGKHHNLFTDKKEVDVNIKGKEDLTGLSTEELLQLKAIREKIDQQ